MLNFFKNHVYPIVVGILIGLAISQPTLFATYMGDATASNQTTMLNRVGASTDAASTSPGTLFAGIKGLIGQVDNAYSAAVTLTGIGSAPGCPGGWTDVTGQVSAGSFVSNTSGPGAYDVAHVVSNPVWASATNAGANYIHSWFANTTVATHGYTTYTLYYRICGLPR